MGARASRAGHANTFPAARGTPRAVPRPALLGLALAAAQRSHAAGPYSLLTTSADGGLRGAALIYAEVHAGREIL